MYVIIISLSLSKAEVVVAVTVLDVNDNAPQFVAGSFEGRVNENQPPNTTLSLVNTPHTQCTTV